MSDPWDLPSGQTQCGEVAFTVPGKPKGQPRDRIGTINGKARSFAGKGQVSLERRILAAYLEHHSHLPRPAFTGPVMMTVYAFRDCPKTQQRKSRPAPERPDTSRPDLDNIVKGVADALNGYAWPDDALITEIQASKRIAAQGEHARLEVTIFPIGDFS